MTLGPDRAAAAPADLEIDAGAAAHSGRPRLAIVADAPAALRAAGLLFPDAERLVLSRDELRPREPFRGPLFERLASLPAGACLALVVPVATTAACPGLGTAATPEPQAAPGPEPAADVDRKVDVAQVDDGRGVDVLPVADHVNLELRGPLTGRWPAGVPRTFPPMSDIYQPAVVRAQRGAQVYSSGVVVAGVADAGRLTPFEASVVRERRLPAVADCLVPTAIVAAYYGLALAACGVPEPHDNIGQ